MAKRLITWKTMVQLGTQLWSKMILMMEMMVRLMVRVRILMRLYTWKTMVQLGTQLWSKTLASRYTAVPNGSGWARLERRYYMNRKVDKL